MPIEFETEFLQLRLKSKPLSQQDLDLEPVGLEEGWRGQAERISRGYLAQQRIKIHQLDGI